MNSEPSGRLYSLVTRHWHRIAAGLVGGIGLVELVVGGLTADSGVEFYFMAWAGTTGGLWFLFDKADSTLSDEARLRVGSVIAEQGLWDGIAELPLRFGQLFDRVFGDRHLSWGCFLRSGIASLASVVVVTAIALSLGLTEVPGPNLLIGVLVTAIVAVPMNVIPDYVSLLQTRWLLSRVTSGARISLVLVLDALLTTAVFVAWLIVLGIILGGSVTDSFSDMGVILVEAATFGDPEGGSAGAFFYSTFFTSVWLWLYAASIPLSRLLVRMNHGVGFLLRVTDVERQPFRSMGFVSVIIASGLFALGLPMVLL